MQIAIDYEVLFTKMLDGFALCEMLYDPAGQANDFRYLMVNPAFEKITGLKNAVGKTVKELIPSIEPFWINTYADVVKTGRAICVENEVAALGVIFTVVAYKTGENHFAAVFADVTHQRKAERHLKQMKVNLEDAYEATIEGWSRALDMRDEETEGHSQRVTEMTLKLCRVLGLGDDSLDFVRYGALLHDIGKIGVPDIILKKPGPLNTEEWEIMRQHPSLAFELISPIAFLRPALNIPLYHHERWDGRGYLHGLKGKAIPIEARAFSVVDIYDALTNDRPYRKAWSKEKALNQLKAEREGALDPEIVKIFLEQQGGG